MQAARPPARRRFMTMTVKGLANPVLLGVIGAAHGIKGELRIKSYTGDPTAIATYGPLATADGRRFEILSVRLAQEVVVARLKGVDDRNAAETLVRAILWIDQDDEPEDDAWYDHQLVGLDVVRDDVVVGRLARVEHMPAQDLLVVATGDSEVMVPFVQAFVPTVDPAAGRIVITPPAGLFEDLAAGDETETTDAAGDTPAASA